MARGSKRLTHHHNLFLTPLLGQINPRQWCGQADFYGFFLYHLFSRLKPLKHRQPLSSCTTGRAMSEIFGECSLCQPTLPATVLTRHGSDCWWLVPCPENWGLAGGGSVWLSCESMLGMHCALWLEIVDMGYPSMGCDVCLKQEWVAWSTTVGFKQARNYALSRNCDDGHGREKDSQVWLATRLLARAC